YQQESAKLRQQIQMLQNSNRHLMGDALSTLTMKELKQLENRLERGITRIRSKKHEMLLAEIEYFQKRVIDLENENLCLRTKIIDVERIQQVNMVSRPELNVIQDHLTFKINCVICSRAFSASTNSLCRTKPTTTMRYQPITGSI
ncbi:agamous-like MADS-box protein AGL11, partial [Vigna radiata var. radiata]|uniref:Agamous-like MADS-box protein AGL11 n=1 Tax=Vigna radiata var. radiata TaxID=3916 RepID=A0A1S3TSC3_VIGRR